MLEINLDNEEKLQVLLAALALFLIALIISLCISIPFCPLNKWLLERDLKRRRQLFQQPPAYILTHQQASIFGAKCNHANFSGPPPAYEAALRAKRLQSLTGNIPKIRDPNDPKQANSDASWLPPPSFESQQQQQQQPQLDFGDYFHQPKDFDQQVLGQQHVYIPISERVQSVRNCHVPIMMRLWVRMIEPGEMVARTCGFHGRQVSTSNSLSRRLSLTRPLSIPHLLGSFVTMAASKKQLSDSALGSFTEEQQPVNQAEQPDLSKAQSQNTTTCNNDQQFNSLSSTSDSSISFTSPQYAEQQQQQQISENETGHASEEKTKTEEEQQEQQQQRCDNQQGATKHNRIEKQRDKTQPTSAGCHNSNNNNNKNDKQSAVSTNSVTSRVLHMNVASISYVKDESIISTKKHNQMNYQHFSLNQANNFSERFQSTSQGGVSGAGISNNNSSKFCQLVISICDIQNVLNSSWLKERSCAILTNSSSIHIQCEILLPKSKSARLLALPLRALQQNNQESSSNTHTVNFESAVLAASVVDRPTVIPFANTQQGSEQSATRNNNNLINESMKSKTPESSSSLESSGDSSATISSSSTNNSSSKQSSKNSSSRLDANKSTNWRHEPSADGKSIIVFSSVPKQIAHQQQLAANDLNETQTSDMIQFDSVFVSPILNKSTIEDGYIRFKVYSTCKYVNETCLAELKLPLKQLVRCQSGDNLGDVQALMLSKDKIQTNNSNNNDSQQRPQQQADFILNNILSNLVTAVTGNPLSMLIEQLSKERQEFAAKSSHKDSCEIELAGKSNNIGGSSSFRLPWTSNNNSDRRSKLRVSTSFTDSLSKLTWTQQQQQHRQLEQDRDEEDEFREIEDEQQLERRIAQNYYRSLMVSHWLNYLVAPSYECQVVEEARGRIILGVSYLPTSNRVIFNVHRAVIDNESYARGKHLMKNLRLHSSTCYLVRFFMVINGRIVKRKQSAVNKKPEWDSQDPITFDLVSVNVDQPAFVVALVMRNSSIARAGSLQNLAQQNCCQCIQQQIANDTQPAIMRDRQKSARPVVANIGAGQKQASCSHLPGVQSEPESLQIYNTTTTGGRTDSKNSNVNNSNIAHQLSCAIYRADLHQASGNNHQEQQQRGSERDLVIGHLVLNEEIWREMRAKPRKQIVRQFKMY